MIRTLGIDLGKNLCSVAGLDASGAIVVRRRVRRDRVLAFTAGVGPCVVALEAAGAPPRARPAGGRTHGADQPDPSAAARARDQRAARPLATGAGVAHASER